MDIDTLSSHSDGKPGQLEGKRLAKEYRVGNQVLDEIQAAVMTNNKRCKVTLLEGNHEHRVCRYLERFPQLKGQLEAEIFLSLEERGINYVKCYCKGDVYRVGNAFFTHGLYTNDHHAKKTVSNFGTNIFYGHTHDVQAYSMVQRGNDKTLVGQSMGCLCRYDLSYIQGNPSKWQQAFGIFYFLPDGFFTYFIPRIFKNRFVSPEGRVYQS